MPGGEADARRAELCLRIRGRSRHGRLTQESGVSEGHRARYQTRDEGEGIDTRLGRHVVARSLRY